MTTWSAFIAKESQQAYLKSTLEYVSQQRKNGVKVYPSEADVFSAFHATPFEDVKVVILGQDPYHGADQAHGLSFSVLPEVKIPPSLKNMYQELSSDIADFKTPKHGHLQGWAEQGVLLLNTVLTVEEGKAHSHKKLGWETFTDKVIELLNVNAQGVVFILWGAHAQKKGKNINPEKHIIIKGPHPSPLSAYRGFFGCRHFSLTNEALRSLGKAPINWQV